MGVNVFGDEEGDQEEDLAPLEGMLGDLDLADMEQRKAIAELRRTQGTGQSPEISPFPMDRGDTRAAQELPELGEQLFSGGMIAGESELGGLLAGENTAKVMALSPVLLSATNPAELAKILDSNFENIGVSQDPGGNFLARNNKTGAEVILNRPGPSPLDGVQAVGVATAFTPAGSLAGTGRLLSQKVALGVGGSAATQSAIEGTQALTGGTFDQGEVALAGILGGAGETVMPMIQGGRDIFRHKAVSAGRQELDGLADMVAQGREASDATGIRLFQGQQTQVPSALRKQEFLPQLPASTQKATKELRRQNAEAGTAVDNFLRTIAPDDAVITGAKDVRTASQTAIENLRRIRSERASPIYSQAFRRQRQGHTPDIDMKVVQDKITGMVRQRDPKSQVSVNLMKVQKKIADAKGDLRKLHDAKIDIDQMIQGQGENAVGNTTKRFLVDAQTDIVEQLRAQSPSYRAAMDEFAKRSPPVDTMQRSIIGKLADLDDTQLKSASRAIFDPAETNPEVIKYAKRVIQDVNPDAWNSILRSELERRIGRVRVDLDNPALTTGNVPGQLHTAIFGNTKTRAVLYNAVDGDMKKNLLFLDTALKRASTGRSPGSPTASFQEIKKELGSGFIGAIQNWIKTPINSTVGVGNDALFNRKARALADLIFDPQWSADVRHLRELGTDSPATARATMQLLRQIGESYRTQDDENE